MDRREQFAGLEEALRIAMEGMRASLWTALPGIVQSFNTDDAGKVTAVIQPAIKGVTQKPDGSYEAVNLPLLPDVPVVFPRGGGCTLTFPVKAGDECLVIFSSRCIDAWWQSGGVQLPMEPRMHALSDGFAILGPQSNPTRIANISTDAVQLRSDDGQAFVQLNPTSHQIDTTTPGNVNVSAGGTLTGTAASIVLNGPVTINGTLHVTDATTCDASVTAPLVVGTSNVTFGGKSGVAHEHSFGTKPGSGTTGAPT